MALAPFRVSLTLIVSDGGFDLPQYLFVVFADCCAQGTDSSRGIEVEDAEKVFGGEVFLRFQPAAGQKGVGGADGNGISESGSYVEVIIIVQIGTVNDAKDVKLVVLPVFVRKPGGDPLQLLHEAEFGV
ncbi:MAG: hypothetical protein IKN89_06610 [Oscillospiraceae bacterium]|nr:hypothetical protein [Oscillospiraceae bacterium]